MEKKELEQLKAIFRILTAKEFESLIENYRERYIQDKSLEGKLNLFCALRDSSHVKSVTTIDITAFGIQRIPQLYEVCECLVPLSEFEKGLRKNTRIKLQLRRLVTVAEKYFSRGLISIGKELLSQVFQEAKSYELYNIQIEAKLGELLVFEKFTTEGRTKLITQEIRELQRKNQLLIESKMIFRAIFQQFEFANDCDLGGLKKELSLLSKNYEKSKSKSIKAYYLLILIEYYHLKNNYTEHKYTVQKLINLLEKNQFLTNNNRMCILHIRLAYLSLIVADFLTALKEIEDGLAYLEGVAKAAHSQLEKVKVLVLLNRLDQAILHAEWLALNYGDSEITLVSNATSYYLSVISFLKQNYASSVIRIDAIKTLTKNKEGWNIWIRLLIIMCNIELSDFDTSDKLIESLRKFIQRHTKVDERIKVITYVLTDLSKQAYDFKVTKERKHDALNNLASVKSEVKWSANSPELVLFHDWFNAKLLKKEYEPNFEVYREAVEG